MRSSAIAHNGLKPHCYKNWIATPSARNDNFNYIHAFSYALKNQFEIMSCNESYDFNHNNFYHNGNNQSLRGGSRSNPICLDCHAYARTQCAPLGDDGNELFSRNDYGKDFIFGFGNNFNYGFLFNRKNQKKLITARGTPLAKEKKR